MKEGIIETTVHAFGNIGDKIKEFIHEKSHLNYTPFYQ